MALIIVSGLPATGKTTLAKQLSNLLDIPLLSKDTVKEFLFDTLGSRDREWSRNLGKISNDFLYVVADELLHTNSSLVLENSFETQYALPKFTELLHKHHAELIEVHCTTHRDIRRHRFVDRNESGDRHPGHVDHMNYLSNKEEESIEKHAPLNLGRVITVDTTDFKRLDIANIVKEIHDRI